MQGRRHAKRKSAAALLASAVAAAAAASVVVPPGSAAPAAPAPTGAFPHHLSARLDQLTSARRAGLSAAATAASLSLPQSGAGSLLRSPDGSRLVVEVRMSSYSPARIAALEAAGAEIVDPEPMSGPVSVSILPQDLGAVGDVPGVEYVGEELTPEVNAVCDATISEGDAILQASALRSSLGVDGTGVRVGVISDSFNQVTFPTSQAQDVASDNLPGPANTCGHTSVSTVGTDPAGADEGRAMAQIVHDLAPGAAIDFESAFVNEATFASNIGKLVAQGAGVIVDDVTYFDEPMYQDGIVEQAVTAARAAGVDYFSSSANNRYVFNGHEVGSYEAVGGYRPTTCPGMVTGYADCHDFNVGGSADPTFSYTPRSGNVIRPILSWAEAWNGINTDLDLFVVDQTANTIVFSSTTTNAGGAGSQASFEFIGQTQPSTSDTYGIVVARRSAAPPATAPRFKLVFAENGSAPFLTLEHQTPSGSDVMGPTTFGHNGGADAMSVGASDVRVPTALNSYSSYGPVTTLFGPVNGSTPAAPLASPLVLTKPDLVASDCNRNTFFGGGSPPRFCGTSSAAPHAAAIAALLRQKFPTATTQSINAAMIATASPIAGVPASFQGGGLVNALSAASAVVLPPPPPVTPDTKLTKTPKKKVKTTKRRAKVSFSFTSTVAGSTFTCSIDGKAFVACSSGVKYKLKKGKHTFRVRATAAGLTDATPATYSFKVKHKKKKHQHR